jgi:hypothetical protein
MKEPKCRKAYEALEDELALAKAVIAGRYRPAPRAMEMAAGHASILEASCSEERFSDLVVSRSL